MEFSLSQCKDLVAVLALFSLLLVTETLNTHPLRHVTLLTPECEKCSFTQITHVIQLSKPAKEQPHQLLTKGLGI